MIKRIKALLKKEVAHITIWGWIRATPLYPMALLGFVIGLIVIPLYRGFTSANDWMDSID